MEVKSFLATIVKKDSKFKVSTIHYQGVTIMAKQNNVKRCLARISSLIVLLPVILIAVSPKALGHEPISLPTTLSTVQPINLLAEPFIATDASDMPPKASQDNRSDSSTVPQRDNRAYEGL
jgi:hypothetical protein